MDDFRSVFITEGVNIILKKPECRFSKEYQMIHIATHGIIDETQPLYSTLVFTQDNDESEDGLLQTYEIYDLNLNCDLE